MTTSGGLRAIEEARWFRGAASVDNLNSRQAAEFVRVLEIHPAFKSERPLRAGLQQFDRTGANLDQRFLLEETLFLVADGALAIVSAPDRSSRHVDALMHVAFGADRMSLFTRELVDPTTLLPPSPTLADLRGRLARVCISGVYWGLKGLTNAMRGVDLSTRRAWAEGITSVEGQGRCTGEDVILRGRDFGPRRPEVRVQFPRRGGGCISAEIVEWSTDAIRVTLPDDVGSGCVGFATPASGTIEEALDAAHTTAGEMSICADRAALPNAAGAQRLEDGLRALLLTLPCPECLPGGENAFTGGRPVIRVFVANEERDVTLAPNQALTLRWGVENADAVAIEPVRLDGVRNQLPAVPPSAASLDAHAGEVAMEVRGTYPWTGAYELQARNRCTAGGDPETRRVEIRMEPVPRRDLWGVATAGYQVEGGIENNDWHAFTTNPSIIAAVAARTGLGGRAAHISPAGDAVRHADLAILERDLERAALLGANAYRFSVEWSRVEPSDGQWSRALEDYYVPVLQLLRRYGLEPVVTLNHLTLPLWVLTPPNPSAPGGGYADPLFQASLRGWENPATVDRFIRYVRKTASALGSEGVRYWITLNEPVGSMIATGYLAGVWPPGFLAAKGIGQAAYFNLLRAHVRAFVALKDHDPYAQVSAAHNMPYFKAPLDPGLAGIHTAARNQMAYFLNDHFLNSVTSGTVDTDLNRRRPLDDRRPEERSDAFFGISSDRWRPALDFVGVNYYRSVYAFHSVPVAAFANYLGGQFHDDLTGHANHYLLTERGWEICPDGLTAHLVEIFDKYRLPVMVTENGAGEADDRYRAPYLIAHAAALEKAREAGVPVLGNLHWSLIDNFEWHEHYEPRSRFGLVHVDRDATDGSGRAVLPRRLTEGALAFQRVAASGHREAASRHGSISPDGRLMLAPGTSFGSLWAGELDGTRIALHLTPWPEVRGLLGMLFDYPARRWVRLDDAVWDATSGRLSLFHRARPHFPEREYEATFVRGGLEGRATGEGGTGNFRLDPVRPHGNWQLNGPIRGPLALSNIGKWEDPAIRNVEFWTGRLQTPSVGPLSAPLPGSVPVTVDWAGGSVLLSADVPSAQTSALHPVQIRADFPDRTTLAGTYEASTYPGVPVGTPVVGARLPDGLPF